MDDDLFFEAEKLRKENYKYESNSSKFNDIKELIVNSKKRLLIYICGLLICIYIILWKSSPQFIINKKYSVITGQYVSEIDQGKLVGYTFLFSVSFFLISSVILYKYFPKYRHHLFNDCEYCN